MDILYSVLINILLFLIGYLFFGSLNTSIILSKQLKKSDIREHNSKNAGATNSLRTYGKKFAISVFVIDVLKTFIPIMICSALFNHVEVIKEFSNKSYLSPQILGLGVVFGHVFPIYYKFKGGKGVACTVGLMASINVLFLPIALIIFYCTVKFSRFVSLGSILMCGLLIIFAWMPWMIDGILSYWPNNVELQTKFLATSDNWFVSSIIYTLSAILVIASHHSNIKRLINKTESKLKSSHEKDENPFTNDDKNELKTA